MLKIAIATVLWLLGDFISKAEAPAEPFPVTKVSDRLFVIHGGRGYGSHVGVCVGDEGLLLVDTMLERARPRLTQTLRDISDKSVTIIINTHGHADHTGANAHFAHSGALIIGDEDTSYSPALIHLRTQGNFSLEFCGETITAHAVEAHTYGDLIIRFSNSNALFMGDTFANAYFPSGFAQGASSEARTINVAISLSDSETIIIPGHGNLDNKLGVKRYSHLVNRWYNRLENLHAAGLAVEEIIFDPVIQNLADSFLGPEHTFIDPQVRLERFVRRTLSAQVYERREITPRMFQEVLGRYDSEDGDTVLIDKCNQGLCLLKAGAFKEEIVPVDEDLFRIRGSLDGFVTFSQSEPERSKTITVSENDLEWRGTKQP